MVTTSPAVPHRSEIGGKAGPVDCVIVGIDAAFSYHKLRVAQRLILEGARFIATNRDSTFPTPHGLVPGAGAIVAAIETATGVSPVTLGKPQPLMAQLILQKSGLERGDVAMVGDRIDTDIISAHRAGICGLFVATGVHTMEVARRAKGEQRPDGFFDDLPALCLAVLGEEATASTPSGISPSATLAAGAVAAATLVGEPATSEAIEETTPVAEQTTSVEGTTSVVETEPPAVVETPFATEAQPPIELSDVQEAVSAPEVALAPEVATEASQTDDSAPEEPAASTFSSFSLADGPISMEDTSQPEAVVAAPVSNASLFSLEDDDVTTVAAEPTTSASETTAEAPAESASLFSLPDEISTEAASEEPVAEPPAAEEAAPPADTGEEAAEEKDDKWWESLDKLT
jgi:hypothetical protein